MLCVVKAIRHAYHTLVSSFPRDISSPVFNFRSLNRTFVVDSSKRITLEQPFDQQPPQSNPGVYF